MSDIATCWIGEVPEIFLIADREMERRYPEEQRVHRPPKIMPMPEISSSKHIKGPLKVTQEYRDNWNRNKEAEQKKTRQDYERNLIKKIAEKERLQARLSELDPSKKKQSKKIAAYNVQLLKLDDDIKELQKVSGINLNTLDHGTTLGRFWNKLKRKGKKLIRSIKRFYRDNKGLIDGVLSVIIPILGSLLCRKILCL